MVLNENDEQAYRGYRMPYSYNPFDARFPQSEQTNKCYAYYFDYNKCRRLRGESYADCYFFKRLYRQVCPTKWTDEWDEQIANNTFRHKKFPEPQTSD